MNFIHNIPKAYPKKSCEKLINWFEENINTAIPGAAKDKKINDLEIKLHEKGLYLLDELTDNEKLILDKLKEINGQNQIDNNIKHEQLVSKEFKKLRSDINKDLDDIVESVKNIKVF